MTGQTNDFVGRKQTTYLTYFDIDVYFDLALYNIWTCFLQTICMARGNEKSTQNLFADVTQLGMDNQATFNVDTF